MVKFAFHWKIAMIGMIATAKARTDHKDVWSRGRAFYFIALLSAIMWITIWKIAFTWA